MLPADVAGCTLSDSASVRDIVENLNGSGRKIVLLLNVQGALVGTVTDGDVRRGLLGGYSLEDEGIKIANKSFRTAPAGETHSELLALLKKESVDYLPLLDDRGLVVDIFSKGEEFPPPRLDNVVVIMAGGMGIRLLPLTATTPKPMLPVGGKPMLEHILKGVRDEGFTTVLISVNYLAEQIMDYFGSGAKIGLDISYLKEDFPLGTAGGLSLIEAEILQPVVVINGDVMMTAKLADIVDYHRARGAEITMGVKGLDTQIPFGVVTMDKGVITGMEEKPTFRNYVNTGIYVIQPGIVRGIERGARIDMPELIAREVPRRTVFAYPIHEKWMDLGHPEDLREADESFSPERKD